MNYFDPTFRITEPIDGSSVSTIRLKIRAWVTSPYFTDLVALYNGRIASQGPLDAILEYLETFSDRWDFRRIARERGAPTDDELRHGQGSARWLSAATGLPQDVEARILGYARHLGLVDAQAPTQSSYDYIVVLGGARLSCKFRPMLAAEIMRGGVSAVKVALLGAARPIPESERDATNTYAPGASNEFDLIVSGGQQAFGFDVSAYDEERYDDSSNGNLSWIVKRFEAQFDGQPLKVVAISAPSSDPLHRRANSADTIVFLLDREKIPPKSRLLLVTSQIYVPYVQLEALRTVALPRNLIVETVGFPGDRMPPLQGLTEINHYLQEIRSAIQAARRFCQAFPDPNP